MAQADASLLSLDRIFNSDEFKEDEFGPFRWSERPPDYFRLVPPEEGEPGLDLTRTDLATGARQTVIAARAFIPSGKTQPLAVEGFEFSEDESKLLIYTNTKRVWRQNTRGDYWVLDVASHELKKLGADAAPSTLLTDYLQEHLPVTHGN